MLTPLNLAVRAWRPPQGSRVDPFLTVMGVWSGIVGAEVARNARPQRLEKGTLHVTTRSSVWSQQLTFLQPHILQALRELPETQGIEKLCFRIGLLRTAAQRAPAGIEQAKLPLRILSGRCDICGVLLETDARCSPCAFGKREERLLRAQRIMYKAPWSTHEEISARFGGLRREEYEEARTRLLRRWWGILERVERTGVLRADGFERRIAESYVLLQSGSRPESISQAAIRNLLGERLEKLLRE